MTSIPQPGGQRDSLPVYDALIAASEREIARQKHAIKQLRRQRRRARRAEVARRARTHSRAGLFWIGNIAFASSLTCYLTGETAVAHELLQFALAAWLSALQLPPQR
ncbi:hypothetical protein [Streptomyces sp. NPDC048489]|uniref:hypothetical protein n=1 Tax=Streptomyces sp. NPDC048489 TaxID=3154504 RepID=UPI003419BAD9